MLMTESQLRMIVSRSILLEQEEKQMAAIDKVVDKQVARTDTFCDDVLDKLDDIMEEEEEQPAGDEALFSVGGALGFAVALPVIMKALGKIAKVVGMGLGKMEEVLTGGRSDDMADLGDNWEEWWNEKSHDLHKKYESWMDAASKKLLTMAFRERDPSEPSDREIKMLSKGLWAVLLCGLGIHAGIHAWHAFHNHTFWSTAYGGYETVVAAVKEGEAIGYIKGLIETMATAA